MYKVRVSEALPLRWRKTSLEEEVYLYSNELLDWR